MGFSELGFPSRCRVCGHFFPQGLRGRAHPAVAACPRLAPFIHRARPQELPTGRLAAGEAAVVWASAQQIAWEWGPQTLFPSALGDGRAPGTGCEGQEESCCPSHKGAGPFSKSSLAWCPSGPWIPGRQSHPCPGISRSFTGRQSVGAVRAPCLSSVNSVAAPGRDSEEGSWRRGPCS